MLSNEFRQPPEGDTQVINVDNEFCVQSGLTLVRIGEQTARELSTSNSQFISGGSPTTPVLHNRKTPALVQSAYQKMDNVKDKVALITGAATGIGYETAEELLQNGAQAVAILDLNPSLGHAAAAALENKFGKGHAIFLPCDVSQEKQFKESFEKTLQTFKRLDIVINNAGISNEPMVEQVINVNTTAVIRGSLLAMDYMGKHKGGKGGTLVNVASIAGLEPMRSIPVYVASKYAVVGFSRAVQQHYHETGVRTLVICPGFTMTAMLMTPPKSYLSFIGAEIFGKEFNLYPQQPVEHVARSMVELIQKGKNGTLCVVEGNKAPYEVEYVHYEKDKCVLK